MEDEALISKSLKNSYIANVALYRNSSVNTSFHTSSRTSETDSSSENKDKKLAKLPTNLQIYVKKLWDVNYFCLVYEFF